MTRRSIMQTIMGAVYCFFGPRPIDAAAPVVFRDSPRPMNETMTFFARRKLAEGAVSQPEAFVIEFGPLGDSFHFEQDARCPQQSTFIYGRVGGFSPAEREKLNRLRAVYERQNMIAVSHENWLPAFGFITSWREEKEPAGERVTFVMRGV